MKLTTTALPRSPSSWNGLSSASIKATGGAGPMSASGLAPEGAARRKTTGRRMIAKHWTG